MSIAFMEHARHEAIWHLLHGDSFTYAGTVIAPPLAYDHAVRYDVHVFNVEQRLADYTRLPSRAGFRFGLCWF